jgi:hypothetical protein
MGSFKIGKNKKKEFLELTEQKSSAVIRPIGDLENL